MIFCISGYDFRFKIDSSQIINIVIENPSLLSDVVCSLTMQINGEEGKIIISDAEIALSFAKNIDFIANPICIDCNNKKVLSAMYKELAVIAKDSCVKETNELNSIIVNHIDDIISRSRYLLTMDYNATMDYPTLFKMYEVCAISSSDSFIEQFINYIRAMNVICDIKVFIVLNLKQFFTKQEIQMLFEFCQYNDVILINIEGSESEHYEFDRYYVIDKDYCIIESL